ncbi:MAG TPA: molecular chaperone DnaK, partial [Candidatus Wolfebacteria bacterium]|nr:molecular chaperone DnaK [Candidatus Wolfebacteria bacterium]
KKKKELVEARNQAEQIVYLAEKTLKDAGDKVTQDIKDAVNKKIEALKSVKDGNDIEAIKSASAELSAELQKIGQTMYGQQGEQQNQQQNPQEPQEPQSDKQQNENPQQDEKQQDEKQGDEKQGDENQKS